MKNEPWVPIGADSAYQGSFDGRGHSIKNISPSSSVRVQSESIVFYSAGFIGAVGHDGVVKRLNIDGDYTLAMTARELDIGTIAGVNFGTIEDCSVTVNFDLFYWNPKSNLTIGGFVAGNAGKIQNCYFVGSLCPTLTGEIGVGGLIAICLDGSIVTNCYLCGSVRPMINGDNSKSYPGLFGTAGKNIITKNLYVNSNNFDTAVGSGGANIQVEFLSSNDMKSKKFAQLLGNHFEFDSNQINHGYPVLSNLSR